MKKLLLLTIIPALLILPACSTDDTSSHDKDGDHILLETQSETSADIPETDEIVPPDTSPDADTDAYTELETSIHELLDKIDNAVPSTETSIKTTQFFDLKSEIELLDNQLELKEDYLEAQYHDSEITLDEYRESEQRLEMLENLLDQAEDNLEFLFQMDD